MRKPKKSRRLLKKIMKVEKLRRYNRNKKGSFEVECWLYDWECALIMAALKFYLQNKALPPATKTWTAKRIKEFSMALSKILKQELQDIRGQKSLFRRLA